MAGRRPEPIESRIARGNPQRRPIPKDVPTRVEGMPEPPEWLQGHALECWQRVSDLLFKRGQLSADSTMSLLALCQTYAEWVDLARDIRENGRFQTVETQAGGFMERARPAVQAFSDCDRRLKGWLIEFGLTDASRAKVAAQAPSSSDEDDPLARYGLN